jgi:hypothetical protein
VAGLPTAEQQLRNVKARPEEGRAMDDLDGHPAKVRPSREPVCRQDSSSLVPSTAVRKYLTDENARRPISPLSESLPRDVNAVNSSVSGANENSEVRLSGTEVVLSTTGVASISSTRATSRREGARSRLARRSAGARIERRATVGGRTDRDDRPRQRGRSR